MGIFFLFYILMKLFTSFFLLAILSTTAFASEISATDAGHLLSADSHKFLSGTWGDIADGSYAGEVVEGAAEDAVAAPSAFTSTYYA